MTSFEKLGGFVDLPFAGHSDRIHRSAHSPISSPQEGAPVKKDDFETLHPASLRLQQFASAPQGPLRLGRWLLNLLLLSVPAFLFVPWQQTVAGTGRVVAYSPTERQQELQAPVSGRIIRWHVVEGSRVKAGDRIADMADIDPDFLSRIEERLRADQDRIEAAEERLSVYKTQVDSYEKAREMKVQANRMKVKMAEQKLKVAEQKAGGRQDRPGDGGAQRRAYAQPPGQGHLLPASAGAGGALVCQSHR